MAALIEAILEFGQVEEARAYGYLDRALEETDPAGWVEGKLLVLAPSRRLRETVAEHRRRSPDDLVVQVLDSE